MANETTVTAEQLSEARISFEIASNDGQRINSSDSNVCVVVLSDSAKRTLLDILEADGAGKEKNLDGVVEKMLLAGITARQRSIEYSRKTKQNASLALAIAECKSPEQLAQLFAKLKQASAKQSDEKSVA